MPALYLTGRLIRWEWQAMEMELEWKAIARMVWLSTGWFAWVALRRSKHAEKRRAHGILPLSVTLDPVEGEWIQGMRGGLPNHSV